MPLTGEYLYIGVAIKSRKATSFMKKNQDTITLIIPAYNEEHRIGSTLQQYGKYFSTQYGDACEIVVVLNGCTDNTLGVVEEAEKQFPLICHIEFTEAIGKGGAIIEGFKQAKVDLVGFTDADASTSPETMDRLFITLRNTPTVSCVVGSRWMPGSVVHNRSMRRNIMSHIFNWAARMYFHLGIKDTQCGAKVLRKEIIPDILPNLTISNMAFDVNLLVDVKRNGGEILEMPIEWSDDVRTTIGRPIRTGVGMFLSMSRLRLLYSPFKFMYPVLAPISDILYAILFGKK